MPDENDAEKTKGSPDGITPSRVTPVTQQPAADASDFASQPSPAVSTDAEPPERLTPPQEPEYLDPENPDNDYENLRKGKAFADQIDRYNAAAEKQRIRDAWRTQKRANNKAAQSDSQETGRQYEYDESGLAQPKIDPETGVQAVKERVHPVRYDENGRPYQVVYNDGGKAPQTVTNPDGTTSQILSKKIVNPDADAEIGTNPDDPNDPNLYRKSKNSQWSVIDPKEGIHDSDNRVAIASAKHLHNLEMRDISNKHADLGLKIQQLRRGIASEDSDSQSGAAIPEDSSTPAVSIPTGGMSPKARFAQESILKNNSDPIPEPKPVTGIFGINQEATAKARADWQAQEQQRKGDLGKAQKLLDTDDQIKAARSEMLDLAIKHQSLKEEGPAGYLKRLREERRNSIASMDPESAKGVIEEGVKQIGAFDQDIRDRAQELQKRTDAILAKRQQGGTPAQIADLDKESAGIQADSQELSKTYEQRNDLARRIQAGAQKLQKDQEDRIQAQRAELRNNPATAPMAERLDKLDADTKARQANLDAQAFPDDASKQVAHDALQADVQAQHDAIASSAQNALKADFEFKQKANNDLTEKAKRRMELEKGIKDAEASDILTAGDSAPLSESPTIAKNKEELAKMDAEEGGAAVKSRQAELEEDDKKLTFKDGKGYAVLHDGNVVINPAALRPEGLRPDGMPSWQEQIAQAKQEGHLNDAQAAAFSKRTEMNAKIMQEGIVDKTLINDQFRDWIVRNDPDFLKRVSPSTTQKDLETPGFLPDFNPENQKDLQELRGKALEFLKEKPSLMEKIADFGNKFTHELIPATVGSLATAAGAAINAGGYAKNSLGDWLQDVGLGVEALKEQTMDPRLAGSASGTIAEHAGGLAGFLIPGALVGRAARAAGMGEKAAMALSQIATGGVGAAQNASAIYREARDMGKTEKEAFLPFVLAGVVGAGVVIPVSHYLNTFAEPVKNEITKGLVKTLGEAVSFASLNTGTTLANNAIAQRIYDENRDLFQGVAQSAESGAISGSILGLISAAVGGAKTARLRTKYGIPQGWSGKIEDLAAADQQIGAIHTQPTAKDLSKQRAELQKRLSIATPDEAPVIQAQAAMINEAIKVDPANVPLEARGDLAGALIKLSQGAEFQNLSETERAAVGKAKSTAGVAFIQDKGGKTVISETAKQWLENTAPHAAKVIRAADGEGNNENPPSSQQQGDQTNLPGKNTPSGGENRPPTQASAGQSEGVGAAPDAKDAQEPPPLNDGAPMAERKARAKTMWDRAQVGDVYHSPDAFGGNYMIEIKANRDGSRYAEITGENGAFIDSIQFDKDPEAALRDNGLIHGQDMTRVKRGESTKGSGGGEEEPPAAPVGGKTPLNPPGDGGAAAAEKSTPKKPLKPTTQRGRALSKVLKSQGVDPEVADHYAAIKDAEYGTGKSEDIRAKILEDFERDGGVFTGRLQQENESPEYWKSAFPEQSSEKHQAYADQAKANNEARKNEASEKNRSLLEFGGDVSGKSSAEVGNSSTDGGPKSIPQRPEVRPLTNKEYERAKILSERLQREAVVRPDVADAFARQQVRDGANPAAIVDNFNKAGGIARQDEIGASIHAAEALHDEGVKSLLKKFAEQHKAANGHRLSVEQRKNIRKAIEALAPAVSRWNKAFGKILLDMKKRGSGGGEAVGMDLRINLGDILDRDYNNLQQLMKDPERGEKLLSEEAIHVLGKSILAKHSQAKGRTAEEIRDAVGPVRAKGVKDAPDANDHADAEAAILFDSLPKDLRDYVDGIYSDRPGTLDSWQLGHEFLRMLAQHDIEVDRGGRVSVEGKVISEQTLEKGIIDQIRDHLAKLFAYFSKLSENLRSGGATEKDISHVEEIRSQIREAIKSLRGEIDLNRNEAYQKAYEDRRTTAGKERPAIPFGGAENNPAGVAVGGGTQGGGLEGVYGAVPGTGNNGGLDKPSGLMPGADGGKSDAGNAGQAAGAKVERAGGPEAEKRELENLRAEKAEREAAAERAEARRNTIVQKQAENTADKEKLLAKVPEEAKGPASDLLQKVHMGDATYVLGANREKLPAVYIAAPPGEVQTSHAGEDFHKNPNYGGENTRNYHNDETEQNKVRQMALPGGLDEDTIVTDAKSAADGAPQVVMTIFNDAEGKMQVRLQTAGGNGREQGINLSTPEDQDRLASAWKAKEGQFGLHNMPEGWRGYRFLGVYDLRDEAQNRAYLQLVDKLNPNQGVVQDTASRADIDAALKIPVDRLVNLPLTMSPKAATDALAGLISDSEKLGLDRNLMSGLVKNPTQAQFYMQRLMLAAAFRSRPLSEFFTSSQLTSGHATVVGLIKSSGETALKLRNAGHGNIAEAIGRTLETIADYVNRGEKIGMAIKKAADQAEMGEDGKLIQSLASAIEKKVAYFPLDKKGIKKVDSEESVAGFEDLMRDISKAMEHHSDGPDIFGESTTLGQTIGSAINAHFAKLGREAGSSTNEEPGALQSRRSQDPLKRMRQLMRKRGEEGLNRYETDELTRLEKAQGQHFMGFFDEARNNDFSLETQREEKPSAPTEPALQMGLFSRKAGAKIEKADLQAYLDFSDVPEEKRPEAEKAFAAFAKASPEPYSLPDAGGVDGDKLRQTREKQAAAYRGLLKGDAEAVRKAIREGVPLSKLIEGFTKREIAPFSIQGAIINSPADLAAHNLAHRTPFFESLKVAVLDNSNQVVHSEIVSVGSLNEAVVHPREVMRAVDRGKEAAKALGRGIQGWMVMHNHPGGDPSPSEADRRITRRLDDVATMMGAPLIDHVITNGETYFSFQQAGLHGNGANLKSKAKPKLQVIPKPEGMTPGAMADFEAVPSSEANEAGKVNSADHLQNIRAVLQTADPGMIHVLHLNTRLGLIAVERIPVDSDPAAIFKSAARYGSYGVALSFPDTSPKGVALDSNAAKETWRPFVKKAAEHGTAYQVPLFDASTKEFSWRAAGLLEAPSEYKTSANEQIGLLSRRAGDSESKKAAEELKTKIASGGSSVSEITPPKGEWLSNPQGNLQLGRLSRGVLELIGKTDKPLVLKPEIVLKNQASHSELTPEESQKILKKALTSPDILIHDQPEKRPDNWHFVSLGERNDAVLVEMSETKDAHEIVGWMHLRDKSIAQKIKRAGREGGRILIAGTDPRSDGLSDRSSDSELNKALNEAGVNPEKGSLMSRRAGVDESGFYSKLERVIDQKIQGKQVVAQSLKALIAKSDSGIKPEEIKWSGISDIIDTLASENGGKVPKQALMDYLQGAGRVRFEERELSVPRADQAPKDSQRIAQKYGFTSEYDPYNDTYTFTDKDAEDVDFQDLPGQMQTELVENTNKLDRKKAEQGYLDPTNPAVRGLANDDEATGVAIGARPVWKINIIPEMRESIQNEGQSLFARRAGRSGQPDLFDDQLDLFAHARKEADAYNDALEKDGITHPEAKTEAAMQDLGLSANQAEDLFARNEQTSENPQQDAPTTNPSQIGSKLVDGEPGSELSLSGEPSPKKSGKIEDFGEKITGAKKDLWQRFEQSINADLPEDSKEISLSKHFPEPDYAKLIEAGFDPERLAAMKAIRDLVPRKPSHPYKLRRWAELVRTLHKTMQQFASKGSNVSNEFMWEASEKAGGGIFSKVMLYKELGYPAFLHAKDWEVEQRRGSTMWDRQGNKIVTPDQMVTRAEHNGRMTDILTTNPDRLAAFKEIADKIKAKIEEQMLQQPDSAPRELKLDVYRDTRTGEYFIGRKGLNGVIRLKSGFTSAKEAMTFREDNKADLSRLWEDMTKEPETRGKINAPRQGPDRRQGDVSPDQFNDAFGFRGVQFGNYVEGERRQADLNHSFDALMDLAEALGVPPKVLSLDGQLGLAFGARGHGNALAHYEPTQVVINLTKKGGPGSLAHEWFHAADHYFSNLDKTGKTDWSGRAAAYATEKGSGASAGNLRPEVAEAFQGIRQAMENNGFAERSKTLDAAKSKPYWSKIIEKAARAFESYVIDRLGKSGVTNDYLANVRSESGAYPKAEELDGGIRAAFDHLFETLDTRETDRGASLFSRRAGKVENDRFKAEEDGLKSPAARLEESRDLLNAEAARFSDMPGYDAKEALQKARIAVANAAKAYDPSRGVPFQAYAREAARNALRDLYRKEALHAERFPESLDASQSEGSPDQAPSPLDQAVAREREKVLGGAISELPTKMQEVVRASLEGSSLQEIAGRMGISKTAAHKLLEVAQRRLRGKLGEKGISDAGSLLSRSAGRSGIDQDKIEGLRQEAEREDQGTAPKKVGRPDLAFGANGPETRAVDDYYSENAPKETRDEWEDEAQSLLGKNEEATRQDILRKGLNGGSLTPSETIAAGIIADRLRRAMQADPSAENKRAFNLFWYAYRSTGSVVARALASRNDPYMRPAERYRSFLIDMMTKPSKAARKAIEAEKDPTKKASMIDEETRRVMEKLRAAGITPEDIFKDRVTLRLADKKITSEFRSLLSRSTGNQEARRAAFDMLLKNKSLEAISKATGLRPQEIQSIKDAFVAKMRQDHFAKFQAGAKADQTSVITGKKVDDAVAEREFKKWLENLGIVSDERQGKPRFNIEDPAHIMRMASAIREARGDAALLDKAYELWVMNILSAPATHVANITGNLGSSALNLTLQRGMESLVNLAVRDEKSAQIGEFQYLMKGLMPGISKGYAMAAKAWSAEHDFFEHTVLGTPLELAQLDKTGNSHQAISGTKGKVIRIPGRALLFADSMFKTAIGQMEAGAMAYRMAKAEGLTGQKLADRIAVLSKTRGEVVADNLAKANVSKEAVKWFAERLAGRDETLDADELVEDRGSDAWQLAREQAAYDMAKKSGWKEDAWQNAVKSAREMTFQQDLKKASEGGNFIEDIAAKLQDARNDNPLLGLVFPFVKTPYNIFRVGIRKSPLGAINLATQAAKGLYSVKNGKLYIEGHPEAVRDLAEQAIAWGAMALLWGAAQGDDDDDSKSLLITGSHPRSVESTGIRGLNERAYGGEYVVRIGGRDGISIPYGRLEPVATVLGTTIDLIRGIKRNGTTQDNMQALWGYMLDQANGKTFLSGASAISDMARGKSNPLDAAKKSFLQALVPNLIRSPLRALDDYIRDSKHAGPLYTMLPAPGLAEEQINPYGEPVKKSGNPLLRIFFNTPVAADETLKSADKLLLNWNRSNPSEAWAPQPPLAEFKDAKGKMQPMTAEETKKYHLAAGRIASARLRSVVTPRAAANPTKDDLDAVKKVFEQAGHEAKSRIFNPGYLSRRPKDQPGS